MFNAKLSETLSDEIDDENSEKPTQNLMNETIFKRFLKT